MKHILTYPPRNKLIEETAGFDSQAALIREEGRRTRSTMWLIALVVIACVIFAPVLFFAAPVVAVLLGTCFMAAFGGAVLGKMIARRRERRIMMEIRHHDDIVIPIRSRADKEEAEQVMRGNRR
jgi:K+ transporter